MFEGLKLYWKVFINKIRHKFNLTRKSEKIYKDFVQ